VEYEMFGHTSSNWRYRNSNKRINKYLEAIPRKHSTDSQQKTAILGISHIIRKVLQCVTGSLSVGYRLWFRRRSTGEKRLVTR
jgi:hypothetical protein